MKNDNNISIFSTRLRNLITAKEKTNKKMLQDIEAFLQKAKSGSLSHSALSLSQVQRGNLSLFAVMNLPEAACTLIQNFLSTLSPPPQRHTKKATSVEENEDEEANPTSMSEYSPKPSSERYSFRLSTIRQRREGGGKDESSSKQSKLTRSPNPK